MWQADKNSLVLHMNIKFFDDEFYRNFYRIYLQCLAFHQNRDGIMISSNYQDRLLLQPEIRPNAIQ